MARVRGHGFDDGDSTLRPRAGRGQGRHGGSVRSARKPPGKVVLTIALIGILITFGVGVAGFVTSVSSLPYRAGRAGTAGTASAIDCQEVSSGRSSEIDCIGTFTAADGSVTVPSATIEGNTALGPLGHPARLHPDGVTMSIVSTATVLFALSGVFGSLILILLLGGAGVLIVVADARRRSGGPPVRAKRTMRGMLIAIGAVAATSLVLAIVASAIGV